MKKTNVNAFLVFVLLFSINKSNAQSDYSPETNVIYYFTKYVEWPPTTKTGHFVIGVYGDDAIYEQLRKGITGRRVGNQKIVISKIENLDEAHLFVSILYIGADKLKLFKQVISVTQREPVLIVTKSEGKVLNGSCMNMKVVNGKVNLEINKTNIESRGLKVAAELLAFDKVSR